MKVYSYIFLFLLGAAIANDAHLYYFTEVLILIFD